MVWTHWSTSVVLNSLHHFCERDGSILLAEGLPSEACRYDGVPREESSPCDGVNRRVEFEEQRLTRLESPKAPSAGWLPKVDLINIRKGREEPEPVPIGYGHEGSHETEFCLRG